MTNVAGGTSRASSAVVGTVEAGDLIKDAGGHFTFTGPKGWAANPEPSSPAVVMLRIERPFRALRVNESAPSEGKSLQQYAKDTLTVIKTNSGFRKGTRELQSTTLGGEPAIIDDFVVEYANVRVLCIRQGIVYTVFFSTEPQAADALQPVVRLVLDTWKFL